MPDSNEDLGFQKRSTKRIKCSCYSLWQDSRYGLGRRLANQMKDPGKWRCTVCGTELSAGSWK